MPKMITPLSDKQISNAKPKDKAYTLPDGQGLQLLISPNGRKSWEFLFTSPTLNKKRKTSFGTYPSISLLQARKKREECKNLLTDGVDPIDNLRENKAEKLHSEEKIFQNVVTYWLEFQKKDLAEVTYTKKKALFHTFVIPFLKDRAIDTIKHDELVRIVKAKALQTPETAKRLLSYFNDLWQYSCSHGFCDFNVVTNIHRKSVLPKMVKKHYAKIVDPLILKELIHAIYKYHGHLSTKNALKFVLHVPLRAGNLVSLKWDFIDFEKQMITIPRNEMKVKTASYDFMLPLSDEAINILKEQHLFTSHLKYVFVADNLKHIGEITPSRALQRMGFNDEFLGRKQRLHSFRGTFRSLADTYQMEHRCSFEAKERALDHAVGNDVERAYTDKADYFQEMKILMDWWSEFIIRKIQ